jgi:hypothetical protein
MARCHRYQQQLALFWNSGFHNLIAQVFRRSKRADAEERSYGIAQSKGGHSDGRFLRHWPSIAERLARAGATVVVNYAASAGEAERLSRESRR